MINLKLLDLYYYLKTEITPQYELVRSAKYTDTNKKNYRKRLKFEKQLRFIDGRILQYEKILHPGL